MTTSMTLMSGLSTLFLGLGTATVLVLGAVADRRQVQRSLVAISASASGQHPRPETLRERVGMPILDRFTALGRRLTPSGAQAKLSGLLDLAGNPAPWTSDRLLAAKALALVVVEVLALLLLADGGVARAVLLSAPAAVFAFWAPDLLIKNAGQKRQQVIRKSLPDALELLTITVEAGMGFDAALNQVARSTDGPLSRELFRVLQEMQMKNRSDAFRALGERTTVDDLRSFVSAMVQADKLGVPVGRVLREQAKEMRLKRRQRAEEQAMKVPVKLLFPTVACILPVLFVVVLAPSFMQLKSML